MVTRCTIDHWHYPPRTPEQIEEDNEFYASLVTAEAGDPEAQALRRYYGRSGWYRAVESSSGDENDYSSGNEASDYDVWWLPRPVTLYFETQRDREMQSDEEAVRRPLLGLSRQRMVSRGARLLENAIWSFMWFLFVAVICVSSLFIVWAMMQLASGGTEE